MYYAEVAFGDGRTKRIQLAARRYSRLKVGNILPLRVAPGFFGVPVILPDKAAHREAEAGRKPLAPTEYPPMQKESPRKALHALRGDWDNAAETLLKVIRPSRG